MHSQTPSKVTPSFRNMKIYIKRAGLVSESSFFDRKGHWLLEMSIGAEKRPE